MKKVNLRDVEENSWTSPKGLFGGIFKEVSVALGRKPQSFDLRERHPFDVEFSRIPAGMRNFPYHSHSAQWEFYYIIEGHGFVRDESGETPVGSGDCFLFAPDEAHQIRASEEGDLVLLTVADNPIGESCHYPDSGKWLVRSPERRMLRSEALEYLDGEE